jgi:Zn-dependent metalloprotease
MIRNKHTILFATLLASLLPAVVLAQGAGRIQALDPEGIDRLVTETGGAARVSINAATGAARFVRIAPESKGSLSPLSAAAAAGPEQKTAAFFLRHGRIFGISEPEAELKLGKTEIDAQGGVHLTYRQLYRGVPVFAGELKSHFDSAGRLTAVNGTFVPQIALDPVPSASELAAGKVAIARVESGLESSVELTVRATKLYVYRTGLAQGVSGRNHLVWEVEVVGDGGSVREFVYIDAHTGKFVDQITGVYDAMFRRAYDGKNLPTVPPSYPDRPFWEEGDRFPTRSTEANNMLLASQETYNFFDDAFSRDSFDDAGAIMDQIFNRGYDCPNASWNGTFISFCPGLTTDDITAHEWGHAYTQYTHNLLYAWQPGALNEAYSDMWGETVDQINGRGLDSPGGPRGDACSAFTTVPPAVTINSPAAIAGVKRAGTAAFGPQTFTLTNDVVEANDGVGTANDGCCAGTSFVCAANSWPNAAAIAGKIAFVDRGICGFAIKVKNAQLNGAVGVIVGNNQGGTAIVNMSGVDATITIPSLSVTQNDGTAIKTQAASTTVNATLSRGAKGTENSYRWLLGEESTGFGEAIRDMWNPGCYGDPGKSSDVNYFCGTADGGGVHTNSGVPNHGYALLADGGTFNGQTVGALGLTKTAHIYYRAMANYQTPTSDFEDHADSLEQACADLIGVNLTDPLTGAPSGQILTSSDCLQVEKAGAAVELRTAPTQCNFQPLLAKNPPAQCEVRRFYTADFESGDAGYTVSHTEVTPADFTDREWVRVDSLPDERDGFAFFAIDPDIGTCAPGGDESGVLHLASPAIALPASLSTPVLTFDHYITSEFGFDGGNLRISVDGGAWTLVPTADYTFNAYNTTLVTAAAGNTDPLAGQTAFSGTDGGIVQGSWGQSQVRLSSSLAGHTVQLRWDFGTDGCTGALYGWFVDDVRLYDRDFSTQVVIDGCNTGVPNSGTPTGCTITELLSECAENAATHTAYTDCVAQTTSSLVSAGIITNKQKSDIQRCAAQADIP